MGILRDFERRLEGAVEGFFARAFRSGLQPVELAKAVQRYASSYKQVGVDGVVAPNSYKIALAPSDAERFKGYGEALRQELAGVVHRTARERGWKLKGPVRIETFVDDSLKVGTYELRGRIDAAAAPTPTPRVRSSPGGETQILEPMTRRPASVRVLSDNGAGQTIPIERSAVLGRLPACEITLDDVSVSRRHARINRTAEGWMLEDLGSTNGVKVNGQRVSRATLATGDEIELGSVRLAFAEESSG